MRLLSLLSACVLLLPQVAHAYPEYPPFAWTEFREEYGMFRWWRGCWFRVLHAYAYITCDPTGGPIARVPLSQIPDLIAMGVLPADSETGELVERMLARLRGEALGPRLRETAAKLTPAPGDGYSLTDVYGGNFRRFELPDFSSYGVFQFDGVDFGGLSDFDRFRIGRGDLHLPDFDLDVNLPDVDVDVDLPDRDVDLPDTDVDLDRDGRGARGSRGERDDGTDEEGFTPSGSSTGFGSLNGGTRMHDIFYRNLGLQCDSIFDQRPGAIFGPTPCTTYPDIFGPVPNVDGRPN